MAGITHAKVSAVADGADTTVIRPQADWNASHVVEQAITDNAVVTVDQADAADNDYAKFTANGIEGRATTEVLTDLGFDANSMHFVLKSATETVNNSAVFQDDDVISFPVVANKMYYFKCWLLITSGTTPDFKYQWTGPGGAGMDFLACDQINTAGNAITYRNIATSHTVNGAAAYQAYWMEGTVYVGANAGNITLQWAQNTANASNTEVYGRSWLCYRQLN
jgi:hypothetical protein